jgi:hypothetical protein
MPSCYECFRLGRSFSSPHYFSAAHAFSDSDAGSFTNAADIDFSFMPSFTPHATSEIFNIFFHAEGFSS